VGILTGLFKLLHPLHYAKRRIKRAVIPRPIRRAAWVAGGVAHPVSRVKYSVRRGVIRGVDKAITPKPKRKRRARAQATAPSMLSREQAHERYRQRSHDQLVQLQEKIAKMHALSDQQVALIADMRQNGETPEKLARVKAIIAEIGGIVD
jgi:hypothetical protein